MLTPDRENRTVAIACVNGEAGPVVRVARVRMGFVERTFDVDLVGAMGPNAVIRMVTDHIGDLEAVGGSNRPPPERTTLSGGRLGLGLGTADLVQQLGFVRVRIEGGSGAVQRQVAPIQQRTADEGGLERQAFAFVLAEILGDQRKKTAVSKCYGVGLDIDVGVPGAVIDKALVELGCLAVRYTTHSNGKTESRLPVRSRFLAVGVAIAGERVRLLGPSVGDQARFSAENAELLGHLSRFGKVSGGRDFARSPGLDDGAHQVAVGDRLRPQLIEPPLPVLGSGFGDDQPGRRPGGRGS